MTPFRTYLKEIVNGTDYKRWDWYDIKINLRNKFGSDISYHEIEDKPNILLIEYNNEFIMWNIVENYPIKTININDIDEDEDEDKDEIDSCDSHVFDGGECLICGTKSLCELCDKKFW
jgi:hypothetical protein